MDLLYILEEIDWDWCERIQPVFSMIKKVLEILRIVVPIALVIMTSIDISKKVINPDDKDGQKKIMYRAIAALIVFIVPTLVKLTFRVIDWGFTNTSRNTYAESEIGLSKCWGD